MAQSINRLTTKEVKDAALEGRLADGGGLYLQVGPTGSKSWLFIYRWEGKRPELGLGPFPDVGLADARRRAEAARACLTSKPKRDPRAVLTAPAGAVTPTPSFGAFADGWLDAILPDFKNEKHQQQWRNTLKTYATTLWTVPIDQVDTAAVLEALQPIWNAKRETAQRLRGRIERVLDAAKAKGLRGGENPARWRGHLSALLPNQRQPVTHHSALPYVDVPAFMANLSDRAAVSAECLRFLILTATRSNEARAATWDEIDLKSCVWTIPATRMKAGKEHRVPLSAEAMKIVKAMHEVRRGALIFPGLLKDRPLSETSFRNLMARMKAGHVTTHGFRSAFRDWCGEVTMFPREIAETALAHTIGDKAEQAYRRGDALEKRRALMEAWSRFCCSSDGQENVVVLHG